MSQEGLPKQYKMSSLGDRDSDEPEQVETAKEAQEIEDFIDPREEAAWGFVFAVEEVEELAFWSSGNIELKSCIVDALRLDFVVEGVEEAEEVEENRRRRTTSRSWNCQGWRG